MCGINGVIGERDQAQSREWISAMNQSMAHRGPDAQGEWIGTELSFGHRRLSIIDTSEAGNQPFFSADKQIIMVFNGEIYNYVELKHELEADYAFQTGSDTEVIIAAYLKWGIDAVHHFIGMWGFALWDNVKGIGYLVRDRLGVKPVYIGESSGNLFFASEIRSLLATGQFERRINRDALVDYLRYQTVHAPSTIIDGIRMLPAGHYLRFSQGKFEEVEYWNAAKAASDGMHDSKETAHQKIAGLLHSSVEMRMRADVPFGAFLSGGIDSSVIVGLMANVSTHPVNTFSITFAEKQWDEGKYSDLVARRFNTEHHPIELRATDFLREVPDALLAMDHPSGDGPNTYVVSKVTRAKGVKMALSGLGGDEVFAGYQIFKQMKQMESNRWLGKTPRFLRNLSASALNALKPSVASEKIAAILNEDSVDFEHAYPFARRVLMDDKIAGLLAYTPIVLNAVSQIASRAANTNLPLLSKVSVAEMNTYMQNVLLRDADQMSMAHALEVRVPFLDHRLVEYVLSVPDQLKFPHTPKQLLTESVGDLIPREIIDRPKMGFTFPWPLWMKNELRSLCEENLSYLGSLDHFKPGAVEALWKEFIEGSTSVTWSRIWPLVVLGFWMKTHHIT